jgi:adenylate cyclase
LNRTLNEEGSSAALDAGWTTRHGLALVGFTLLVAQILGSAFNIYYNLIHVRPLLSPLAIEHFAATIRVYNSIVYPGITVWWVCIIWSLRRPFRESIRHRPVPPEQMARARQRVINLPWWAVGLSGVGWLLCIPVFLISLEYAPGPVDSLLYFHLTASILIGALIALTQALFAVELVSQSLLYPVLFRDARPAEIPGTLPISLRARGLLWAAAAGVCPILSLLLLIDGPMADLAENRFFAFMVGMIGIVFGLISAWLLGRLVAEPVDLLRRSSQAVAEGDLKVQIGLQRADEFGTLIDQFNRMVSQLREKQHLERTFGRHVSYKAAEQILQRDPQLRGIEQQVTILFADLRNFTARCGDCTPQQTVSVLNLFLKEMAGIVEGHGGIVAQFMGDGLMTIFGVVDNKLNHASSAVAAGREMLARLEHLNMRLQDSGQTPLAMGIGIHTGPAVVGTIGSPERMDYTAIGDTVNLASSVELLTKQVGHPLLLTSATRDALPSAIGIRPLVPQLVPGRSASVMLYCLDE